MSRLIYLHCGLTLINEKNRRTSEENRFICQEKNSFEIGGKHFFSAEDFLMEEKYEYFLALFD